jgi:hypothetical protein
MLAWSAKLLAVAIIVFTGFQWGSLTKNTTDFYGKSRLTSTGIFITDREILGVHDNPRAMVDFNLNVLVRYLGLLWPNSNPMIALKPVKEMTDLSQIDPVDPNSPPLVTIFYQNFDSAPDCFTITGVKFSRTFMEKAANKRQVSLEKLATAFKEQIGQWCNYNLDEDIHKRQVMKVAYQPEELAMLKCFAGVYYTLSGIILFSDKPDSTLNKENLQDLQTQHDAINANWILAYSHFFINQHEEYVRQKNQGYRLTLIAILAILAFCLFCLIRPGLYSVIQEEIRPTGIILTWPMFFRLIWSNLGFLMLPLKTQRARLKIRAACQRIRDVQLAENFSHQADLLWQKIRPKVVGDELNRLKSAYRIAVGQTNKIAPLLERQRELFYLLDAWQKIEREGNTKSEATGKQIAFFAEPVASAPAQAELNRRQEAERRVRLMLTKEDCPDLDKLTSAYLDRLAFVLLALSDDKLTISYLLKRGDLKNLLSPNSRFMQAILAGDSLATATILRLPAKQLTPTDLDPTLYWPMVNRLKIVVIGGGLSGKETALASVIKEFGAYNIKFINPFENLMTAVELGKQAGEETLFLHFIACTSHKVTFSLLAHRRQVIHFRHTSPHRFKEDVIRGLLRLR